MKLPIPIAADYDCAIVTRKKTMEHWQVPYLGIRQIPSELNEFELTTFFTYSDQERALIDARRNDLYRLAIALHIGFVRMTGRMLDAYKQVPKTLWAHLGKQLGIDAPEVGTLRALYETRPRTLTDHQKLAYEALGFGAMTEPQRRHAAHWLKQTLFGCSNRDTLLGQLKRWLYEQRILIAHERELKRLIAEAVKQHEAELEATLLRVIGEAMLDQWGQQLAQNEDNHGNLQQWLWAVPLRRSTVCTKRKCN
jgi:hypothetical protein